MSAVKCVEWDVNHDTKTITATVRLDFFRGASEDPSYDNFIKVAIPRFVAEIERRWRGKFKCYDFRVKVDANVVPGRSAVRAGALDVEMTDRFRTAQTRVVGERGRSLSDSPEARLVTHRPDPGNPKAITAWSPGNINQVAHEVGHILGLEDGYVEKGEQPEPGGEFETLPGNPEDVMANPHWPVLPETITKVVRRNMLESGIKCPITLDAGPSHLFLLVADVKDVTLHAYACDYDPPSSDPDRQPRRIEFKGKGHFAGEYLTRVELPPPLDGASGVLDVEVSFSLPVGKQSPLAIDANIWLYKQEVFWSEQRNLPWVRAPLVIHARQSDGTITEPGLDSYLLVPGPPLYGVFTHGAKECD